MGGEQSNSEEGLYAYIKEHPSILISIISGIVIIVGFLFKVLIYMNECRYLEYWHLNRLMININDQNQLYEMVIVSFLYLTIVSTQCFVSATLRHYQNRTQVIGYNKILLKSVKKEYRKVKKTYINKEKLLKDTEDDIKLKVEWDKIISILETGIKDYKENIKKLRKLVLKNNLVNVFWAFVFSTMLLGGSIFVYFAISSSPIDWKVFFMTLVVFIIIIWFMPYMLEVYMTRLLIYLTYKKKKINEKTKICIKKAENYLDNKEDYVLTKILNFNIRNYVNRKSVFSSFVYAIMIFITFVGFINKSKTNEMINNMTYGVTEYDNVNCVIIYRDDSFIYLEECIIADNKLTIFVDKQRRIENGELYYVNRDFSDVTRIDLNGEIVE